MPSKPECGRKKDELMKRVNQGYPRSQPEGPKERHTKGIYRATQATLRPEKSMTPGYPPGHPPPFSLFSLFGVCEQL
jgi:hypothetical protein